MASWSSIDYFGRWKALHYITRRYFAPLLLSVEDAPPQMGLHVTSDLMQPWRGTLNWSLETLDGKALRTGTERVDARALASTQIDQLDFSDIVSDANRRELVLVCELYQGDERVAMNVSSLIASKHMSLKEPAISVTIDASGDMAYFHLTAMQLARFVELSVEGADLIFSDNYFDLPVGRPVTVSAQLPAGWSLAQLQAAFSIRSLYDSFA